MLGIDGRSRVGAHRVLLVPGDCPLLDPTELEQLLTRPVSGRSALIVPDRHGDGTNALLLTPPDALTPAFGEGSRRRHIDLAKAQGSTPEVVEVASLALDIDTPEDLELLIERLRRHARRRGAHARHAQPADAQPERDDLRQRARGPARDRRLEPISGS